MPQDIAPASRLAAWALLAFDTFLLAPLLIWASPLVLGLFFSGKIDSDLLPILVTMTLGAWSISGVCISCGRHAWNTLQGRAEPEPLHWYVALVALTLFVSGLWAGILLLATF